MGQANESREEMNTPGLWNIERRFLFTTGAGINRETDGNCRDGGEGRLEAGISTYGKGTVTETAGSTICILMQA